MLIKLTHPEPNYELWIESDEIVVLERYNKAESILIKLDDTPTVTAIVLRSGRIMSCKETPEQIMSMSNLIERL